MSSKRKSVMMASDTTLKNYMDSPNVVLAKEATREFDRREKNKKAGKAVVNDIEKKVEKKTRRASKTNVDEASE